jgi:hypothetical protein
MQKLTTIEKRAILFCNKIKERGAGECRLKFSRGRDYENCSLLNSSGDKIGYATGCGYDKESSVVADALRFLGNTEDEIQSIWLCSGCGNDQLIRTLDDLGWVVTGSMGYISINKKV